MARDQGLLLSVLWGTTKTYLARDVISAKAEELWSKQKGTKVGLPHTWLAQQSSQGIFIPDPVHGGTRDWNH